MYENGKIYMGLAGGKRVELALNMCNRHGLIAGASGTGKTITMKAMAAKALRRGWWFMEDTILYMGTRTETGYFQWMCWLI